MARAAEHATQHPRRIALMAGLLVVSFVVLSVRLYDLQVVRGAYYGQLAEQNRLLLLPVPAERGVVYDRNKVVLVRNVPGFGITVLPADLTGRSEAATRAAEADLASKLAPMLGMSADDIASAIRAGRARSAYEPVLITKRPVARDVALLIEERKADLPGVEIRAESIRQYENGPLYSPVIGYVGPLTSDEYTDLKDRGYLPDDVIGRTGLEQVYENYLRGTYGMREVERDAAQREIKTLGEKPPTSGGNLVLTIDDRLQKLIAERITRGIADRKMQAGVGIAMNPNTGEILALVSVPSYDNNAFVRGITAAEMAQLNSEGGRPLVNKAIADQYPPGSTFKLVTGLAALNEGVANRNTVVNVSSRVLTVDGWNYYDWTAHGRLNFIDGFAHSSDIYFYTMGGGNPYTGQKGVGADNVAKYGHMLGFGAPSGIDLPGEVGGIMPSPEWKLQELGEPWTIGNTYHMSIGQGYDAVTPMQLLQAYAAVANGGTIYRPHLLKEVDAADGSVAYQKPVEVVRKLDIKPENLRIMREAARKVVTSGHAWMPNAKLPIAGKTGTAEFGAGDKVDSSGQHILAYHNWFVSFLPKYDSPDAPTDIAMVIFAYNTSFSCEAAFCPNPAIQITQQVLEAYTGVASPPKQAHP